MVAAFQASDEIPQSSRRSPFQCKGILYVDAFNYYDAHIPGGREAVLERIRGDALLSFAAQPFLVGGWYDVFPFIALNMTAAVIAGRSNIELVRSLARWQVTRQFQGLYSFILKLGSPDMVAKSLPRMAKQYYDFVRAESRRLGPKVYESCGFGIPANYAPTYMLVTEVGVILALELAGAKRVRHKWLAPAQDGEAHGVPIVCVRREITWE